MNCLKKYIKKICVSLSVPKLLFLCLLILFIPAAQAEATSTDPEYPEVITLVPGECRRFVIDGYEKDGYSRYWESGDTTIANVDPYGYVVPIRPGQTLIRASVDGCDYYFLCIVEQPYISQEEITLTPGETVTLTLEGTERKPEWRSKSPNVATVDENGLVTAVDEGGTEIEAELGFQTFICTVSIYPPEVPEEEEGLSKQDKKNMVRVREILSDIITEDMTDVEKVKAVHDYIVLHTAYDYKNYKKDTIPRLSYTIEGVLFKRKAVCSGYANAFQLFMDELSIPCMKIYSVRKMNHVWNLVQLDGKWYHVDATWDDPIPDSKEGIMYNYFLVTDREIKKSHQWPKGKYPACTSGKYMYYAEKPFIIPNAKQFKKKFISQLKKGRRFITIAYPKGQNPELEFISAYVNDWTYFSFEEKGKYEIFYLAVKK